MKIMKRIADVACLVADLMPALMLVGAGLGFIVGGTTGALWY
jgi:hypothetical protein